TLRTLITRARLSILFLAGIISLLLFLVGELAQDGALLGVSKATWQNVTGGVFAAFLFYLVQWMVELVRDTETTRKEEVFRHFFEVQGIHTVFTSRGAADVKERYTETITNAKKRVWAVGMTNRHFATQHATALAKLLSSHPIEIVVVFWDPAAVLSSPTHPT